MITGINIYQNYYIDAVPHRQEEIEYCRRVNRSLALDIAPISYREVTERMTYNQVFAMTEQQTDKLNIIANSDIYFDTNTLKKCVNIFKNHPNKNRLCFALTRWDVNLDGSVTFMNRADSQDVWIFYGAVPQIQDADFYVGGVAGCDNKIAYLLSVSGYEVVNPSFDIVTYHLHNSNIRNYIVDGRVVNQIPPPYKMVYPCQLVDVLP